MKRKKLRLAVLGTGAWGTALADLSARIGHSVSIWSHEAAVASAINERRTNSYLSGIELAPGIRAHTRLAPVLGGAELVVSAVPCQFVREVLGRAARYMPDTVPVISASKGIELSTRMRMEEVVAQVLAPRWRGQFGVMSGPSFAFEVVRETPTAVVAASGSQEVAELVQSSLQTKRFRIYTSNDVVGVELSGALKNVIALAAGITVGLDHGHNAMAALVSRGLAEMIRLGVSMGAEPSTFAGLAGIGDLLLTCTGSLSRNRTVGVRLGAGEPLCTILSDMKAVAEGVRTVGAVRDLARRQGVEMPITEQVYQIAHRGRDPASALDELMERSPRPEDW